MPSFGKAPSFPAACLMAAPDGTGDDSCRRLASSATPIDLETSGLRSVLKAQYRPGKCKGNREHQASIANAKRSDLFLPIFQTTTDSVFAASVSIDTLKCLDKVVSGFPKYLSGTMPANSGDRLKIWPLIVGLNLFEDGVLFVRGNNFVSSVSMSKLRKSEF
jgi:hypothetical protein